MAWPPGVSPGQPGGAVGSGQGFRWGASGQKKVFPCPKCDRVFNHINGLVYHKKAEHDKITFQCVCGKVYKHRPSMVYHQKSCRVHQELKEK